MPAFLLDLLLVTDVMMSVIVLMVAMYITKPVDFNVFPTNRNFQAKLFPRCILDVVFDHR